MNDELLLKARELLAVEFEGREQQFSADHARDGVHDDTPAIHAILAALKSSQPVAEGGKGEKAVQDELPLATPVPPVDWKAVYANEATKFRAETIRTSELTAMVKRCVSVLIDDHPPGPWSRGCIRCKIVEDAEELLARPINVAAIPLYAAPQPAAQQPAGGKWRERWEGSGPQRGWHIVKADRLCNNDHVTYLGESPTSEAVSKLVASHNAALRGDAGDSHEG